MAFLASAKVVGFVMWCFVPWSGHIVEIQQPVVEIVSQFVHKKSMMVWFSTSVDTARPSWTAQRCCGFLPGESQAGGNCDGERMLRAVGLEAAAVGDVVLHAWFCKDADAGRDIVLHAYAHAG